MEVPPNTEPAGALDPVSAVMNTLRDEGMRVNFFDVCPTLVKLVQAHGVVAAREAIPKDTYGFYRTSTVTPLHCMCHWSLGEYAELLVARGADVHAVNIMGWTPLFFAVEGGSVRCARAVLAGGGSVAVLDSLREGVLCMSNSAWEDEMMDALFKAGAGVGEAAEDGARALWLAASRGDLSTVRKLVERGVDAGETAYVEDPVKAARRIGCEEVVEWLTEHRKGGGVGGIGGNVEG